MEHENSPPPSRLYNGPPLSLSEPTIEFHDKYFIAETKVTSSGSLSDMHNFRLLISPFRFFVKKRTKQETTTTITGNKQTNKSYSYRLFCLIPWYKYLQIFHFAKAS